MLNGNLKAQIGSIYPCLAHAHNDYEHDIPLSEAIDLGFKMIEVDVVLFKNQIIVSHDDKGLDQKPRLDSMYLEPLARRIKSLDPIWLMIDIKYYNDTILSVLNDALKVYDGLLVKRGAPIRLPSTTTDAKIKIILSGDIPRARIMQNKGYQYFFVDGRKEDIGLSKNSYLMPLISMDFKEVDKWRGIKKPSKNSINNLRNLIEHVHVENKKIRFWKTKDNEISWMTLLGLGVDIIGVDDKQKFYTTMNEKGLIKNDNN